MKINVLIELEINEAVAERTYFTGKMEAALTVERHKLQELLDAHVERRSNQGALRGARVVGLQSAITGKRVIVPEHSKASPFEQPQEPPARLPAGTDLPSVVSKLYADVGAVVRWLDDNAPLWRHGERLASCEAPDKVEERLGEWIDAASRLG